MIIALAGAKGSGKDEAAKALVADGWTRVAFADPVREMLYILNPIVDEDYRPGSGTWQHLYDEIGYDRLKQIPEARRLMQCLATEVVRDRIGANVWRDLGLNAVAAAVNRGESVVLTDLRFDNEALALRHTGATIVRITRASTVMDDAHISERPLPAHLVDRTIVNDATIASLHAAIRQVVSDARA